MTINHMKLLFGDPLGEIFHELAGHKESTVVEGHLMGGDHVHMCLSIPPKYAVSNVVGYSKGKSAIQIARRYGGRQRNFTGENFWARGYFVSTVGLDEEMLGQPFGKFIDPRDHPLCREAFQNALSGPHAILTDVLSHPPQEPPLPAPGPAEVLQRCTLLTPRKREHDEGLRVVLDGGRPELRHEALLLLRGVDGLLH